MAIAITPPQWSLHEAKNRLSELIHRAEQEGPQTITRHGTPVVVVAPVQSHENPSGQFVSAWDMLRDEHVAAFDGVPDVPRRVAEPSTPVSLPW